MPISIKVKCLLEPQLQFSNGRRDVDPRRALSAAGPVDHRGLRTIRVTGLFNSAISGIRQGVPGEPFPRDLETKSKAESILRSLSRFSPAYQLYEALKNYSEWGIERARLDREAFEE